jgi:glycosyltransferase involved in cell wall biosynthesis
MRSGCGIKNKVLEAWAVGKPVVMTSLATNGLAPDYDQGSLMADMPHDFADAVARLLLDRTERCRLGRGGYDLIPAHYTWSQAAETLTTILGGARRTGRTPVQPEPDQSSPGASDRSSDQPQPA